MFADNDPAGLSIAVASIFLTIVVPSARLQQLVLFVFEVFLHKELEVRPQEMQILIVVVVDEGDFDLQVNQSSYAICENYLILGESEVICILSLVFV